MDLFLMVLSGIILFSRIFVVGSNRRRGRRVFRFQFVWLLPHKLYMRYYLIANGHYC
jgi:hypothetical protein